MPANPFEEIPPDERGRRLAPPAALRHALDAGARLIQVRGACGCGKTTALRTAGAWLEPSGAIVAYHYLPRQAAPPAAVPGGVLLVDEAQRAPRRALRRLAREQLAGGGTLILGSHADHRLELAGLPARLVTIRLRTLPDEAAVRALLASYAGLDAYPPAAIAALRRAAGGNPEAVLRLAYELAEDVPAGEPITPEAVRRAAARLRAEAPELWRWRRRHWAERLRRR